MPKDELLAYKSMLEREVDHQDIEQISKTLLGMSNESYGDN